jgi:hypothetical protein
MDDMQAMLQAPSVSEHLLVHLSMAAPSVMKVHKALASSPPSVSTIPADIASLPFPASAIDFIITHENKSPTDLVSTALQIGPKSGASKLSIEAMNCIKLPHPAVVCPAPVHAADSEGHTSSMCCCMPASAHSHL